MKLTNDYIRASIEINLFFQRIMKEHLFFIETNLQPNELIYINRARILKQSFENLLLKTTYLAKAISLNISNEYVTPYTLKAEELTSKLTGASLNTDITKFELENNLRKHFNLEHIVSDLNKKTLTLLKEVIEFKELIFAQSLKCQIFITVYQEMIKHDIEEAKHYYKVLSAIQNKTPLNITLCEELNFWNHIMQEHAEFIDGMLDPTEKDFKKTARMFINYFEDLVSKCIKETENHIINNSFEKTNELKEFKTTATIGLINCQIRSVIPPLLADHVLREANHYLKILRMLKKV